MIPDPLHDEVFGELGYDPPMEEWYANVPLSPEQIVEVAIYWDEETDGPFEPILDLARTAFRRLLQREPEHRRDLAVAMLKRYERCEPDEELPTAEEVARGLAASRVSIRPDGSVLVIYDDPAELFGDHSIFAEVGIDGTFRGFTLQG